MSGNPGTGRKRVSASVQGTKKSPGPPYANREIFYIRSMYLIRSD